MFYLTEEYKYENIKKFVNSTNNNEYELLTKENEYTHGSKTIISVKHKTCGNVFSVICSHFYRDNNRCPKCVKALYFSSKTQETFEKEVFEAVGDEYKVIGKYINNSTKIDLLHKNCRTNLFSYT